MRATDLKAENSHVRLLRRTNMGHPNTQAKSNSTAEETAATRQKTPRLSPPARDDDSTRTVVYIIVYVAVDKTLEVLDGSLRITVGAKGFEPSTSRPSGSVVRGNDIWKFVDFY